MGQGQEQAKQTGIMGVPRVLVMGWMLLFGMIGTGLVGPNLTSIEGEFHLGHGQVGLALALIQLGCAAVVLGFAARWRRLDSAQAFLLSLAVQAAGFGVVFVSRSTGLLASGWTLITLGTVLGSVANNVSARLWPRDPARGVALLHGFNGVGKVAGPLVAAFALYSLDWRLGFLIVGGVTLTLFAGFWQVREPLARLSVADIPDIGEKTGLTARQPFTWFCFLLFGLIAGGDVVFATLLPSYYETQHGVTREAASLLLTIHLLGLACGRFAFVALGRRLGSNAIIGGCLACGVFVLPAVLLKGWGVWALSEFGVGVMFSSTWPTYYAQAARFFPARPHLLDYGSALGNALGIALLIWAGIALTSRYPALAFALGPAALCTFGILYFLSPLSKSMRATI